MSRIGEYAKKTGLPLVVACGKGIEGEGILHSISRNQATVRYDGFDQTYKLPDEMDDFCIVDKSLDDKMRGAFQKFVIIAGLRWENERYGQHLCTRHIRELTSDARHTMKKEFPIRSRYVSRYEGEEKVSTHGFFGEHAADISFEDERDFVVALAYLATPGKCSVVADVPPNHYEEFDKMFPHVSYNHNESHKGCPCQFSIQFHGDLNDIPPGLASETIPSDESRIIRSAFVYDLVEHRGFVFGAEQDTDAIRNKIPEHYRDIFDEYLERFKRGLENSEEEMSR